MLFFVFLSASVFGQAVEFTTNAPRAVEAGTPFRIEFSLNTKRPDKFTPPEFTGVNVIAGPSESSGQSVSYVNGQMSQSQSYIYTYVLQIPEAGIVTIPAAHAVVDGKNYQTRPVQIEVVSGGSAAPGGLSGASGGQKPTQPSGREPSIDETDVLIRMIPSATTVYKGQPLRLQFKLLTRANLASVENVKYPSFNGFWTHEIDVSNSPWQTETYDNKVYETKVIREFLLFPQQSGILQIDQMTMTAIVQLVVQNQRRSIFDDFFGGGASVQNISRQLMASPVRITVRELPPGAPAGFDGAVGQFTMDGGISSRNLGTNSSGTYDIRISGTGNFPLINAPTIETPTSFEQYSANISENYHVSGNAFNGSKNFSVPFIPRAQGEYAIPPVAFSYFDPSGARYVTLQIPAYDVNIVGDADGDTPAGLVAGMSKEEVRLLGEDIRFIRLGDPKLKPKQPPFLWSWGYLILVLVLLAGFAGTLTYMQKQIRFNNDKTLIRNKRAQKVALRRFRSAEKSMLAKDDSRFYDEILKGLWGYMGDKLNIPVADLSREKVREQLRSRGVEEELVDNYIAAIAECEFAQYAPSANVQVGDVYNKAVELISKFESKI